eukprot:gene11019-18983_t
MVLVPYRTTGPSANQAVEERVLQVGGHVLRIKQMPKASGALLSDGPSNTQVLWGGDDEEEKGSGGSNLENVGLVVWQLGFVVSELLLKHPPWGQNWQDVRVVDLNWQGVRVVELGTGTGLVGIALALSGAHVTLTDLDHIIPLTRENVESNCCGRGIAHMPTVARCCWGSKEDAAALGEQRPDLITAADVLYEEKYYPDLLDTLTDLSAAHTLSYIAYKRRNVREESFIRMAEDRGFSVEVVPSELLNEEYSDGQYVVLRLCRLDTDMDHELGS